MNLRDLEYVVSLAELRHFGRAAAHCFVSQPTLSGQIKKLEKELGVLIFERHPHQVHLTAVGEVIVAKARHILNEALAIQETAQAAKDPYSGTLHLAMIPTLGPYLLPQILPRLQQRFPNMEWLLYEYQTAVIIEKMLAGQLDLAVLALPLDIPGLTELPVFDEPFWLGVGTHHPLANQQKLELAQLAQAEVLLLDEGHCLRTQALSLCQKAGAQESATFRATSLETLKAMVSLGKGVTLLPELAAQMPLSSGIKAIPFVAPVPSRSMGLLYRASSGHQVLFTGLAELLRQWWQHRLLETL